jgi:hypothetical protein
MTLKHRLALNKVCRLMSQQISAIETVEAALRMAQTRLSEAPSFSLYRSIVAQLEYLAAVLDGKETDRSRLKKIIIGRYGVMEFETTDPEFADALTAAQLIASNMARGLKV